MREVFPVTNDEWTVTIEQKIQTHSQFKSLNDEDLLPKGKVDPLFKESEELTAIFYSSRKTARNKWLIHIFIAGVTIIPLLATSRQVLVGFQ